MWDERREILQKHEDYLSTAPRRAIQKVIQAGSYFEFLTSIRWGSRLRHLSGPIAMRELFENRQRAVEILSELLHAELDGTITPKRIRLREATGHGRTRTDLRAAGSS